jgi:hypothetical protein
MWECGLVKQTWTNLNILLKSKGLEYEGVNSYSDIFNFGNSAATNMIRLKIIQQFIQIKRRTNLEVRQIENLIEELLMKEKYIANKNKDFRKYQIKWKRFI